MLLEKFVSLHSTQSTEARPCDWGQKEIWERQISKSKGVKGMQFLLTALSKSTLQSLKEPHLRILQHLEC